MLSFTAVILAIFKLISCDRVVIRPDTDNPFIKTYLTPDPRGLNQINNNNKWRIRGTTATTQRQLNDWALTMTLDAKEYGFEANSANSTLTISLRSYCTTSACDTFYAFQIGNNEYITFTTDFDSYIYPKCGGTVAYGDASVLIKKIEKYPDYSGYTLTDDLAGDYNSNWYELSVSNQRGGHKGAVAKDFMTFEFVNNDIDGTFTFRFGSHANGDKKYECVYDAVSTGKDFKLYMTPDWKKENIVIRSFMVNGDRYRSNRAERLEALEEDFWELDMDEANYEAKLFKFATNGQGFVL